MQRAKPASLGTQDAMLLFHCPGCECAHGIAVIPNPKAWEWNGDLDKITISPSILVLPSEGVKQCHSFVRDGQIQFLNDCDHHLAGQMVDLPEWGA